MGRHKKPIELHKRDGTYQSCRHRGPEPKVVKMKMPRGLKGDAAKLWKKLAGPIESMGVYTESDELAMRLLCESYAKYVEADLELASSGTYFESTDKQGNMSHHVHPAVKARSLFWQEVITVCRQFGLTPSARTGLPSMKVKDKESSVLDKILAGSRN